MAGARWNRTSWDMNDRYTSRISAHRQTETEPRSPLILGPRWQLRIVDVGKEH